MKIYYVTNNKGKIELANSIYKDIDIEIIQEKLDTPEIQSLDSIEVANYSSKYAANLLNKPVLKNDSGLGIDALGGFPGALAKYAEDTITPEGYIKLLANKKNRKATWIEVLSYCEPNKEPVYFISKTEGTLSTEVRGSNGHGYDKIFIPKGYNKTFAEMEKEEVFGIFSNEAYLKLYEYLKNTNNN